MFVLELEPIKAPPVSLLNANMKLKSLKDLKNSWATMEKVSPKPANICTTQFQTRPGTSTQRKLIRKTALHVKLSPQSPRFFQIQSPFIKADGQHKTYYINLSHKCAHKKGTFRINIEMINYQLYQIIAARQPTANLQIFFSFFSSSMYIAMTSFDLCY